MDDLSRKESEFTSTVGKGTLATPAHQERSRKSLNRILAAAEVVLRREGMEGFSIAAIAEASGLSVGGIYARVKGKQELYQLIKDATTRRIASKVCAAVQKPASTLDEVVNSYVAALISGFARDEKLHKALFSSDVVLPEVARRAGARRQAALEVLVAALVRVEPKLTRYGDDDLRFGGDIVTSHIINAVKSGPVADWEWLTAALGRACRGYYRSLLAD